MKPRKLRDISEVPGFEHQSIKLKPVEMLTKARKWLRKRGFTDELARIEQMSERSRFNAAKKKGSR